MAMSDEETTVSEKEAGTSDSGGESSASENLLSQHNAEDLRRHHARKRNLRNTSRKKRQRTGRAPKRHRLPKAPPSESDEGEDGDEFLQALPEYLKRRREAFDKRAERFRELGLRLPPSYDDVVFSDDEDLESLEEKPDFPDVPPAGLYEDITLPQSLGVIPASIARRLREYQVAGVKFLHKLFVYQNGGILGDDMGLGKTIQVVAFLTVAFGKTGDERDLKRMRKMRRAGAQWYPRILLVCPGGLFENWQAELRRWGYWHVDVYHGNGKEDAIQAAKAGRLEIMLTTYSTYCADNDTINMVEWDCVIADEFHQLKNGRSSTTQAMNEVNALCRIGLTGTAIQNSYDELWTLLNWTNPGVFGTLSEWKQEISNPLRQGQSHSATIQELGEARRVARQLTDNLLPRFFLRRMKTLIAHQLPRKTDRVVFCPLTETQVQAYESFLDCETVQVIKTASESCPCGSGKNRGWCCYTTVKDEKWQAFVFPAIATLQKLANHIAMLIPQDSDPGEKQAKDLELLQESLPDKWRDIFRTKNWVTHYANMEFCGKWKVLKRLLRLWHESGDKVLVFSHSVRLLKMLRMLFQNTSYNASFLDGSMPLVERAAEVERFNADHEQFVFLISTKAGGIGLNITSANKVVIFDPNWNPSYDLQAQDRAYRIGQTRDVEVFRLVSAGTIEEIVYARQIYKQQQANIGYNASNERRYFTGIQANKNQKGEIFGLANMFAYQGENVVLKEIVNKTNVAESRAKVSIADLDVSQNDSVSDEGGTLFGSQSDDENAAMSQLADLVTKGETSMDNLNKAIDAKGKRKGKRTAKKDPVQAILAQAGVEYTHENSEVIGSSRIESKLSRRAEKAGYGTHLAREQVFQLKDDESGVRRSSENLPKEANISKVELERNANESSRAKIDTTAAAGTAKEIGTVAVSWRYNPAMQIRQRQFGSMAAMFGYEDLTEFALVVEGMTQAERRDALESFYTSRRRALGLETKTLKRSRAKENPKEAADAEPIISVTYTERSADGGHGGRDGSVADEVGSPAMSNAQ